MSFSMNSSDIFQTIHMIAEENLDIRTTTMGISLKDCVSESTETTCRKIYDKITTMAENLVPTAEAISKEFGIPIVNKRISVTPISMIGEACADRDYLAIARTLDRAAKEVGVDFLGGYGALVQKGMTKAEREFLDTIPEALATTDVVCSSVNIGSSKAGINMDAVAILGRVIKETAELTADQDALGCAKFVAFCNAVEDNPFMAGAFYGVGEGECCLSVGVSGPGVVLNAVKGRDNLPFDELAELIKRMAFKITRSGEMVGQEAARRLGVPFGIVDLSLAPTAAIGDSVADILEAVGLEKCGTHGTTAALAMLNDAVKKGGAMASSHVGGLSGAFIPVSEDAGMIAAAKEGSLSYDKLEAMTCVCSVGIDMVAIPGDTPAETITAMIADEAAIGMINKKTTAVRVIPVPGKGVGEMVEFGGLLGRAPIMDVHPFSSKIFAQRGGRIPAPIHALNN